MSNFKGIATAVALGCTMAFGAGIAQADAAFDQELTDANLVKTEHNFKDIIGNILQHFELNGNYIVAERVSSRLELVALRLSNKVGSGYKDNVSAGLLISLCLGGDLHGGKINSSGWEGDELSLQFERSLETDKVERIVHFNSARLNAIITLSCVASALDRSQDSEGYIFFAGVDHALLTVKSILPGGGFGDKVEHRLNGADRLLSSQRIQ